MDFVTTIIILLFLWFAFKDKIMRRLTKVQFSGKVSPLFILTEILI